MMDGPAMVALLGKTSDAPEVKDLIRQLGGKDPKLKKGDTTTYVLADKLGLDLMFSDEAYLTRRPNLAIGEGKLFLTSVRFKTDYPPKVKAYTGTIPHGIAFSSSHAALKKLLGKPHDSDPDLSMDQWLLGGNMVAVRYNDQMSEVKSVVVFVPPKAKG
jgi:hypothetical protein